MRLKKVKDAKETVECSCYYVNNPEDYKGKWKELFGNNSKIQIEIGMGKGRFIIGMAKSHPDINFIGIEKYDSVLVKATKALEYEDPLPNLKLLLFDAEKIEEIFDHEIDLIYLNFSDPWPKNKHEKRRLTSENFLKRYDNIFKDTKQIVQKTDNLAFFEFSLDSLRNYGYTLDDITYDLYSENDSTNIATEYEEKFKERGIKINRVKSHKE